MHSETRQKKYFPEPRKTGHFSSFGHIFQPELQKNFGSPIHLTLFHIRGGGGRFCPPSDCLLYNFR